MFDQPEAVTHFYNNVLLEGAVLIISYFKLIIPTKCAEIHKQLTLLLQIHQQHINYFVIFTGRAASIEALNRKKKEKDGKAGMLPVGGLVMLKKKFFMPEQTCSPLCQAFDVFRMQYPCKYRFHQKMSRRRTSDPFSLNSVGDRGG